MAGIVAYMERLTPVGTHLRDEWRIVPFSKYTFDQLTAWLGPHWSSASYYHNPRFILEHRYIRAGVDEGWKPFDLFPTREKAMEAIDSNAVSASSGFTKVESARIAAAQTAKIAEMRKREAEDAASVKRAKMERSNDAFARLSEGKNAALATAYNAFVEAHGNDPDLKARVLSDRSLYDAVMDAETVPAKARAIKAFLARYASTGGKRRRSGSRPRHAPVCRCGHTRLSHRPRCTTPGCFCYGFEKAPTCARCGETAEYCRCPGGMVEKAAGKRRHSGGSLAADVRALCKALKG